MSEEEKKAPRMKEKHARAATSRGGGGIVSIMGGGERRGEQNAYHLNMSLVAYLWKGKRKKEKYIFISSRQNAIGRGDIGQWRHRCRCFNIFVEARLSMISTQKEMKAKACVA
jgi:hypothetical protein